MDAKKISDLLTPGLIFTKADFTNWIRDIKPEYSERSIYWLLNKLQMQYEIVKLGRNLFQFVGSDTLKSNYNYKYSPEMTKLTQQIEMEYPLLDFQVWELIQLNEFLNHQIAHNTLFIEVEHMLERTVFEFLKKQYQGVLLCPSEDTYYQYKVSDNTIVILRLLSQTPKTIIGTHNACLEKILVDLFSRKLPGQLIEKAEYPAIYEDAFSKYHIDERKMFRYAKRRNIDYDIFDFIQEKTSIQLLTKGN